MLLNCLNQKIIYIVKYIQMDKAWFDGGIIDIQGVTIIPNRSAKVQALCYYNNGVVQMKWVSIEGEEYTNWASDDDYLIALVGHKLGMGKRGVPVSNLPDVEPAKPITPYTFTAGMPTQSGVAAVVGTNDDNCSIHNDADIARIQSLQEQLDAQATKLKTITDLLFKNGAI
jgi:hypothetical protein